MRDVVIRHGIEPQAGQDLPVRGNRLIRLSMEVSSVADDLLTQMYHNSKRPAAPTAAVAPEPDTRNATATAASSRARSKVRLAITTRPTRPARAFS